jgi:L-fuculose-phosphate aldolase
MSLPIQETRQLICELGRMMFERRLTDSAGGNISARLDDVILITPRQAGSLYRWHLQPDQVLIVDLQGKKIEGRGEISREARVHFRLLNNFYPDGSAVVHGHAMNALVFCAFNQSLPSVLDDTDKFGNLIQVENHPAHSPELAEVILEAMRGEVEHLSKQAAAVLAPRHGVFVLGKDLNAAYDALERIDVNAYCVLMGHMMGWIA